MTDASRPVRSLDDLDRESATADPARSAQARRADTLAIGMAAALDEVAADARGSLGGTLGMVNLLDADRQLVRGRHPALADEQRTQVAEDMPVAQAFCPYTVAARDVLLVEDLRSDIRTASSPLLDAGLRAYAGAPVMVDGQAIGTVCVVDDQPHPWTDADAETLRRLADGVAAQLRASAP